MKTREQLEKLRQPLPEKMVAALKESEGIDFSEHVVEDEHGVYSTGLFRWKGKNVLITIDEGKWHLSASTNHPIGYYEMKELRYEFLPNAIHAAQVFPPREEFVNIDENSYHLYEIDDEDDDKFKLSGEMPTYDELTEMSANPVTGSDLKFQHFETTRTICKNMLEAMLADGVSRQDLPQLLHDVCKFVILTEANVDKEGAVFVLKRFVSLTSDLSVLMMRIMMNHMDKTKKK